MVDLEKLREAVTASGFSVSETFSLPPREPRNGAIPEALHPKVRSALVESYPNGLYRHQAEAIQRSLAGDDVCLATPTASGKSLAFMTVAAEHCCQDRFAKVIALYPSRALIQDQKDRWERFTRPFGLRVGHIDGNVLATNRSKILTESRIVLMTPDVMHAWFMSRTAEREVASFLAKLAFVVMDEAHIYDGVFGTNMAYLMRRLALAKSEFRLMASTATVGQPELFIRALTGRRVHVLGVSDDGSGAARKELLLCPGNVSGSFDAIVRLLNKLVQDGQKFIAFGDSRKVVERIVAAALRHGREENEEDDDEKDDLPETILPYRAGYEEDDRTRIQRALSQGDLAGVVSTSALELGLDIGDLDVVILLNSPSSSNAFWQRIGRAGRREDGACVILDDQNRLSPLSDFVARQPEAGWLYLENRYIQYANALCAAAELQARGVNSVAGLEFEGLPEAFAASLENELNPTTPVPPDLYSLKQKGQASPHLEFPLRSAMEQGFKITGPMNLPLGDVTLSQMVREAYPGGVYYYLARAYRVVQVDMRNRTIATRREKALSTRPDVQTMVFPQFDGGVLAGFRSENGFLAEVQMQVSERVNGFFEQRGRNSLAHKYGPDSLYSRRPLNRFFQTTGVCWTFEDLELNTDVVKPIAQAFCFICGIHERDIGVGNFHANKGPYTSMPVKGVAIYDSTNGSLRLTQRLPEVLPEATRKVLEHVSPGELRDSLEVFLHNVLALQPVPEHPTLGEVPPKSDDWTPVIKAGQPAMYQTADGALDVTVVGWRYTPQGLMYELAQDKAGKWMVLASALIPIHGRTEFTYVNLVNGEERPDFAVTTV